MFPAPSPTTEHPKIASVFASTRNRMKPSVLSSQIARSLSLKSFSKTRYSIPNSSKSFPYRPTLAISGEVKVAYGINKFDIFPFPKKSALRMTMRAMKSAACVNLNCEQQSPTPKMRGFVVWSLSFTMSPFLVSYSTLASSKSMPVTFGRRPAATKSASNSYVVSISIPFSTTVIFISGYPLSRTLPLNSIPLYSATESLKETPSLVICCFTTCAMSSSSFGRTLPERPKTVTWVPNRCIACASSIPITPGPITPILFGCLVMLKNVSFVTTIGFGPLGSVEKDFSWSSFNPSMGTRVGYPPVAITAFLKLRVLPFTTTDRSEAKTARPMYTSTPNPVYLSAESWWDICARTFRTRSMTFSKSTRTVLGSTKIPASSKRLMSPLTA
mmetsp:Transcript_14325/g.39947  ORF Transcript_14325/g.39947 Transcript_14325/m.39947 type:complete len:386 (+) Transcript_14325:363-1520(+)